MQTNQYFMKRLVNNLFLPMVDIWNSLLTFRVEQNFSTFKTPESKFYFNKLIVNLDSFS